MTLKCTDEMRMQLLIIHQKFMRVACYSKVFLFIYFYLDLWKQVQIIIFPVWYSEKKKMDQNQNIRIKRIATL